MRIFALTRRQQLQRLTAPNGARESMSLRAPLRRRCSLKTRTRVFHKTLARFAVAQKFAERHLKRIGIANLDRGVI